MFDSLQSKLDSAFKHIRGKAVVGQKDLDLVMKEVRMALLEADVNFKVAKEFCAKVAEESLGEKVQKSFTSDQQIIKIVHEQLSAIMGDGAADINLNAAPPVVFMLVGLQGAGKTTTAAKLARLLRDERKRKPLLVSADVYRPAAIEQLKTLGQQLQISVFDSSPDQKPLDIAKNAHEYGKNHGFDVIIIDTAGRLQIDQQMMDELKQIAMALQPQEILLVADAMTGQEAVNVASGFHAALDIDGLILTKLDGDARGGAALSMRAVTGCPIKFIGIGEKSDALEIFHPDRMASRILGMGDVMSLIEKATKQFDMEESLKLHEKMKKNEFTLDDFLDQMRTIKKMGSIGSLMGMIPGMSKMTKHLDEGQAEKEMKKVEAIILSMTPLERRRNSIIDGSRRKRIANGSGTRVQDVNDLLKQFTEMKKVMNKLSKMGIGGMAKMLGGRGMANLKNIFGN